MEAERAEHRTDHDTGQAAVRGDRGQGRDHAGTVLRGAGQGGAGASEVGDGLLADPHEEDQAHVLAGHRDGGDLTGPAGGAHRIEGREQVDAEGVGRLVGTGTEEWRAAFAREDREGPHLGTADLVR